MSSLSKMLLAVGLIVMVMGCHPITLQQARQLPDRKLYARISQLQEVKRRRGLNARRAEDLRVLTQAAAERRPKFGIVAESPPVVRAAPPQRAARPAKVVPRQKGRALKRPAVGANQGAVSPGTNTKDDRHY